MKIMQIINNLGPGGSEKLITDLCQYILNNTHYKNIQIYIVCFSNGRDKKYDLLMKNTLESCGVKIINLEKKAKKDRIRTIIRIRKILKIVRPDIIHCHLQHITFFTAIAAIGLKIPTISTIHNTVINYKVIERITNLFISHYIAISPKVKKIIINELSIRSSKISVILNAVDCNNFFPPNRKIKEKVNNIIAVGRLEEQKDHKTLIEAYSILKKKLGPKLLPSLYIVGDGELKQDLIDQTKKHGLEKYIDFLGIRLDIPDLLKKADLYVMSSLWEGLSISLIEAAAVGLPTVATDVGCNSDIVKNGISGMLVLKNDPYALAEAMEELILDPKKRRLFSVNLRKIALQYSLNNCTEEHLSLYKRIINS